MVIASMRSALFGNPAPARQRRGSVHIGHLVTSLNAEAVFSAICAPPALGLRKLSVAQQRALNDLVGKALVVLGGHAAGYDLMAQAVALRHAFREARRRNFNDLGADAIGRLEQYFSQAEEILNGPWNSRAPRSVNIDDLLAGLRMPGRGPRHP